MTAHQTANSRLGGWPRCSANGTRKTPGGFAVLGLLGAWPAAGHCALSGPRWARERWRRGRGRGQRQLTRAARHGNANRPVVVVTPLTVCLSHASRPVASRPSRTMHGAYQMLYVFTIMDFMSGGRTLAGALAVAARTAGLPARVRSQPGPGAWNGEAMPWRAHGTRHSLQLAAWNCMVPSRQVTAMVWPGPKRPSNKAVESGFSKLRWMARFMGLAP